MNTYTVCINDGDVVREFKVAANYFRYEEDGNCVEFFTVTSAGITPDPTRTKVFWVPAKRVVFIEMDR